MSFSVLLEKMLIFVLLMGMGYVCGRTKYVSPSFTKDASRLVLNVFMVASILNSVIGSELSTEELFSSIGVMSLVILISFLVGFAAVKLPRIRGKSAPTFEMLISAMNNMFFALPVVQQIYGSKAAFYVSISSLPINIVLYSYGIWRLNGTDNGKKINLKKILTPPLIAAVLSVIIAFFKLPVPNMAKELLKLLAGVTVPLSMFVVGASLADITILEAFMEKKGYLAAVFRLVMVPVLVFLVLRLIDPDPLLFKSAVITAAAPSAVVVAILSVQYRQDYALASKGILLSIILSLLTTPVWVLILG